MRKKLQQGHSQKKSSSLLSKNVTLTCLGTVYYVRIRFNQSPPEIKDIETFATRHFSQIQLLLFLFELFNIFYIVLLTVVI